MKENILVQKLGRVSEPTQETNQRENSQIKVQRMEP